MRRFVLSPCRRLYRTRWWTCRVMVANRPGAGGEGVGPAGRRPWQLWAAPRRWTPTPMRPSSPYYSTYSPRLRPLRWTNNARITAICGRRDRGVPAFSTCCTRTRRRRGTGRGDHGRPRHAPGISSRSSRRTAWSDAIFIVSAARTQALLDHAGHTAGCSHTATLAAEDRPSSRWPVG